MTNILKESPDMFGFEARRLDKMLQEHAKLDFREGIPVQSSLGIAKTSEC